MQASFLPPESRCCSHHDRHCSLLVGTAATKSLHPGRPMPLNPMVCRCLLSAPTDRGISPRRGTSRPGHEENCDRQSSCAARRGNAHDLLICISAASHTPLRDCWTRGPTAEAPTPCQVHDHMHVATRQLAAVKARRCSHRDRYRASLKRYIKPYVSLVSHKRRVYSRGMTRPLLRVKRKTLLFSSGGVHSTEYRTHDAATQGVCPVTMGWMRCCTSLAP